jgi:hypothetical protein
MQKKFKVVAEYRHAAPFIGMVAYDNFGDALESVRNRIGEFESTTRVWVYAVTVYCDNSESFGTDNVLVAENGLMLAQPRHAA